MVYRKAANVAHIFLALLLCLCLQGAYNSVIEDTEPLNKHMSDDNLMLDRQPQKFNRLLTELCIG